VATVTGAAVLDGLVLLLVGGEVVVSGTVGDVVSGSLRGTVVPEPVERGTVTTTGARVVAVEEPAGGPPARVVGTSTLVEVDDVEEDEELDVVGPEVLVAGRTVVKGDTVASWVLVELSVPVTASNSRATRAIDARTYSPALKR